MGRNRNSYEYKNCTTDPNSEENNVSIVSFHLFGVWWWLSKEIVNFVDMISFLININQWLKRSNDNNIHSLKFD